jgi:hypothetical protein
MMLGKRLLVGAVAGAFVIGTAGAAMAVSDGNYDYNKQHCSAAAANSDYPDRTEPDCRTLNASLWTGSNGAYSQDNEVGAVGIHQAPDGDEGDPNSIPHDPAYNGPGATAQDHAAEGLHAYFGADDNLDFGEHDSSEKVDNGPSDGGGIQANIDPASLTAWVAALSSGDAAYLLSHPGPLVSAGAGAGADGIMFSVQTERQVAFEGTGDGERDVADYAGKKWDPETCSGPDDEAADCADPTAPKGQQRKQDITYWEAQEGKTYAEPGVQVYEDPDAQASPLGPYPLPAAYAGTCGVILGGGGLQAPASPVTNSAGQFAVQTGCTSKSGE